MRIFLLVTTLVSVLGDAYLVYFLSPEDRRVLIAFFLFSFVGVSSFSAAIFYALRERFRVGVSFKNDWPTALRRGGEVGFLAVVCGFLQINHVLNWVYALFILTALVLTEIFFAVRR